MTEEKKDFFNKRNRNIIYTVVFLIIFLVLFFKNNSFEDEKTGPYPPHYNPNKAKIEAAYNFTLESTDGKEVSLNRFKGKVIILDFWATWCPPCRKGIPDLISLKKEYGNKGLEIIGISLDSDDSNNPRGNTKKNVVPFMKEQGINYPVLYGNIDVTEKYGGIYSIPTSFIIDKEGKIVKKFVGLVEKEVYENEIKKLL